MIPTGNTPEVPYAGTSGWSGSDTSRERAEHADADGTTSERQALVLRLLAGEWVEHGDRVHRIDSLLGVTWRELSTATGWHHGQSSGVLSVLHKAGRIDRLADPSARRFRCAPYVLPEYVNGRPVAPQGRHKVDDGDSARIARALALLDVAERGYDWRTLITELRSILTTEETP